MRKILIVACSLCSRTKTNPFREPGCSIFNSNKCVMMNESLQQLLLQLATALKIRK